MSPLLSPAPQLIAGGANIGEQFLTKDTAQTQQQCSYLPSILGTSHCRRWSFEVTTVVKKLLSLLSPLAILFWSSTSYAQTKINPDQIATVNTPANLCNINGALYILPGCFPGSDIGAQINSAYAALPANGGIIIVPPSNSCYSYSTPIVMTTSAKYVLLEALQPATIASPSLLTAACLNYTPTTATTALTMHFVPTNSGNPPTGFGLRNISLINNMCLSSGGCGSSATGIDGTASSDWSITGAVMDHVTVYGFNIGYRNATGPILPDAITWYDPIFAANNIAMTHGTLLEDFNDGTWAGNGCVEQAVSRASPELYFSKPTIISNNTACNASFDFTNASELPLLNIFEGHLESRSTGTNGAHYFAGRMHLVLHGGVMEDDATSGTGDWMANLSGTTGISVDGLVLSTGGKTYTNFFVANASVRGRIEVIIQGSSPSCGSLVGGANASFISQQAVLANSVSGACAWTVADSPVKIGSGTAITSSGVGGTIASANTAQNFTATQTFNNPLVSGGTTATLSGTGACATITAQKGGSWSGSVTCTGTTGASTITIVPGTKAPNGWSCFASNITAGTAGAQSGSSTATCQIKFARVTQNDVLTFSANAF
jgi:hypothetical protein